MNQRSRLFIASAIRGLGIELGPSTRIVDTLDESYPTLAAASNVSGLT